MRLFIKIVDGKPFEHPYLESNLVDALGIDPNTIPNSEWALFERREQKNYRANTAYEVFEGVTYDWEGDKVVDVFNYRQMTQEERDAYNQEAMTRKPFDSWIFNYDIGIWEAPVPIPETPEDAIWFWDEENQSWYQNGVIVT